MKEKMQFLPRKDILTLEEIERLCDNFIELGVEKIRLTGGEPLVRNDIIKLIENFNKFVVKSL
jgi:cyclic pyranopterin phosphate synthase